VILEIGRQITLWLMPRCFWSLWLQRCPALGVSLLGNYITSEEEFPDCITTFWVLYTSRVSHDISAIARR
jgi:hypothetical protein